MSVSLETLKAAHKHAACHRNEVLASNECACFYCETAFLPASIEEWIEETGGSHGQASDHFTALCPSCGIDSVIGDAAPFAATDAAFLRAMNSEWFGADTQA